MNNEVLIDLDSINELPELTAFQGRINIKKNGKLIVKNSVLENIDTLSEEELRDIFTNLKRYISPIVTSGYIPSPIAMKILEELAPEFKVRFKTEKPGTKSMVPISSKEFFEGEKIFDEILAGMKKEWSEEQKYKYLYNKIGQMLSYDLNVLRYDEYGIFHDKYARNIFTAVAKNWGLCSSFAAGYDYMCYKAGLESNILSEEDHAYVAITTEEQKDYLTDSTFDSVAAKFGLKMQNFAISEEQFQANGHHLEDTEVEGYQFESMDQHTVEELDRTTGYLEEFGGDYTDKDLIQFVNTLQGKDNFEKAENFLQKVETLKTVGRPTAYDFERMVKWMLSKCEDKNFVEGINADTFVYENTRDLPRKLAIEVQDKSMPEKKKSYIFEDLKKFQEVDKIEVFENLKER